MARTDCPVRALHEFKTHTFTLRLFVLILILPLAPLPALSQNHKELKTVKIADAGDFEFVALSDLAEFLDVRTFYSGKARKAILYIGDSRVKVTAWNPFVQIDGRTVQLPLDTRYAGDDILVPLHFFSNLIRPLYPGLMPGEPKKTAATPAHDDAANVPNNDAANAPNNEANITKVLVEEKANGTLIRIQTSRPFSRKHITSRFSRGWMYVDVVGGKVAPDAVGPVASDGLIKKVTPVQTGSVAQLSFQLRKDIDPSRVTIGGQGKEILVSLSTQEVVPTEVLRSLETEREKWLIDTIVIDPGHGGRDPGAIAADGTKEKNITLGVGKRLKRLLEDNLQVRALLTREKDVFVKLEDRTTLANSVQGKLFVSLHCNANRSRRVNGTTTYFLGPAKTDEALEVALLENSVIKYESDAPEDVQSQEEFILTAMAQNAFNRESEVLAALIQEEMRKAAGLPDRGVHQAGFRVLVGASMPNVLVEMAFLSNAKEARLLKSGDFQEKIAKAIFASIKKFKDRYETGS